MPSSTSETIDVVIIGSGPTGLMLACLLSRYGIKFRIFDKSINHTTQSRALVVHARSLEIFNDMGIGDEAVRRGEIAKGFTGYFNGKQRFRMDMNVLQTRNLTKYPFILVLEQSKTEGLLEDFLSQRNIQVDRQCELIHFEQLDDVDNELIECTIKDYRNNTEGELITIRTKYLCGCDGAHSKVREHLQLSFPGNTYDTTLFVLDCHVRFLDDRTVERTADDIQLNVTSSGLGLLFPLKDHNSDSRYRVVGTIPHDVLGSTKEIQFEDIQSRISQHLEREIHLYDPLWMSIYRTHHRYVESFSVRNKYFLLGDAAHIHSPVGGQGMNTGLQDAFNLAWKLAFIIQGKAINDNELLNTYNEERIRVAQDLVQSTDRIFTLMTSSNSFFKFIRLNIVPYFWQYGLFPLFNRISIFRDVFFKRLSMIGINYRQSTFSVGEEISQKHPVQPGDRMPFIYTHPDGLFTCISVDKGAAVDDDNENQIYFNLITLVNSKTDRSNKPLLFVKFIQDHYSHLIKTHEYQYGEETKEIYHVLGLNENSKDSGFLIRPDQYIAYCTETFNIQHFDTYFSQYFHQKKD